MRTRSRILPALLVAGAALPAAADTIYRVEGEPIEDVTIVEETITSIIYKQGRGRELAVPTETVLEIEYEKKPPLVDEADTLLLDGALGDSLDVFEEYLEKWPAPKLPKTRKWAPAYSANRVMEIKMTQGDMNGVKSAANRLIESYPESRFLPGAFLAKADAEFFQGNAKAARGTLEKFQSVIDAKGLNVRWRLECRLGLIQTDTSLRGAARRKKLKEIELDASKEFPTVRSRALVAIGESLLEDKDVDEARGTFQEILDDPKADAVTLAGAYSGLGDCLFQQGVSPKNDELLVEALDSYMRVVVLYTDQSRYAAKSMFYAALCFDNLNREGDRSKARKLYSRLQQEFPTSKWAEEAAGKR